MLESIQAMSLLTIMEVPGPLLLAAALIYGTVQWSRRTDRTEAVREQATRRLYQEAAKEEGIEANVFRSQRSDADTNTLGKCRTADRSR